MKSVELYECGPSRNANGCDWKMWIYDPETAAAGNEMTEHPSAVAAINHILNLYPDHELSVLITSLKSNRNLPQT